MSDDEQGPPYSKPLFTALRAGDLAQVRALAAAGADLHYVREHGYTALIDTVFGRDVVRDPHFLELLGFLIAQGVDLDAESSYREGALSVLARQGRFDAVRLLVDAGADRSKLRWTPLHEAVVWGSLADLEAALAVGADLEARDHWLRTPWLLALFAGDVAKADLLRRRGANVHARGHCEAPPVFFAVHSRRGAVVQWMLDEGADLSLVDEFGNTPLIEAVEYDALACVEVLLRAGVDLEADVNGTALNRASTREVIIALLAAGANPAELRSEHQRLVLRLPEIGAVGLDSVSCAEFEEACTRRFGRSNPERMDVPFWQAMIRSGDNAYAARKKFYATKELRGSPPVWCAQRFGQSLTVMPDGRAVQIGGEHEDYYDPDFCIYNDVFVYGLDGAVTIYGYPEAAFPPTDFHTATLVEDFIYVIGSLGYVGNRRPSETPVYRLDLPASSGPGRPARDPDPRR